MFDEKTSRDIIKLCRNRDILKHFFQINHDLPLVKVSPNSLHFWTREKDIIEAIFWGYDRVAHLLLPLITKLDIARDYSSKVLNQAKREIRSTGDVPWIYLDSGTYFSGGGDGRLYNDENDTWANKRNKTTATSVSVAPASINAPITQNGATGLLARFFVPKNTSSIGAGATVTAATDQIYVNSVTNPDTVSLALQASTQDSGTGLVDTDFNNLTIDTPTEFATRINYASLTAPAYNDFVLNASGIAAVSVTGTTKLVYRDGKNDIDATEPIGNNFINVDGSTGTNPPKLVVTYTGGGRGKLDLTSKMW